MTSLGTVSPSSIASIGARPSAVATWRHDVPHEELTTAAAIGDRHVVEPLGFLAVLVVSNLSWHRLASPTRA